jgi:hypothetical protein
MKKTMIMRIFRKPVRIPFRAEEVQNESARTDFLQSPDNPKTKEDDRHRESEIEVGVGAAQKGAIDVKRVRDRIVMAPADSPRRPG